MAQSEPAAGSPGKCPICGRPTELAYRPFCSRRCADVDLSRWLRGTYAIPGAADAEEDGESTEPAGEPGEPDTDEPGSAR